MYEVMKEGIQFRKYNATLRKLEFVWTKCFVYNRFTYRIFLTELLIQVEWVVTRIFPEI